MDASYVPIDCGLHDRLELLAMRGRAIRLRVSGFPAWRPGRGSWFAARPASFQNTVPEPVLTGTG